MEVRLAKTAGFCFGVKRAMKMAWDELELNSGIYASGPLIHNKQAVQKYEDKGLITVDTINDIPNNMLKDELIGFDPLIINNDLSKII